MLHSKRQCWRHWSMPANGCFMLAFINRLWTDECAFLGYDRLLSPNQDETRLSLLKACGLMIELVWSDLMLTKNLGYYESYSKSIKNLSQLKMYKSKKSFNHFSKHRFWKSAAFYKLLFLEKVARRPLCLEKSVPRYEVVFNLIQL